MRKLVNLLVAVFVWGQCVTASADGELSTDVSRIGKSAPSWNGLAGVDGKTHSLDDIADKFVVVALIANHCSLCQFQEKELIKIQNEYRSKSVKLVAISVSNSDEDRLPRMIERATASGYNFPYLHDPSQNVSRALRATRIPTVFLINEKRKVVYYGAIDDDQDPVQNHYLRNAIDDVIAGRPVSVSETKPIGCGIRYD